MLILPIQDDGVARDDIRSSVTTFPNVRRGYPASDTSRESHFPRFKRRPVAPPGPPAQLAQGV